MAVRIKICGITRVEDAREAVNLGAEFIGLNFYRPSPRYLETKVALEISRIVAGRVRIAGVFVNATREYIAQRLEALKLDLIQLHGDEDEAMLGGWPVPVIRTLRLRPEQIDGAFPATRADFLLIDRFDPQLFGGTGQPLPYERLRGRDLSRVFISGGLTPANVADAVALNPYAVDVASGVESAPGIKDHSKLRSFFLNANSSR
jgi:phosphoribosylanthranilate isomerase